MSLERIGLALRRAAPLLLATSLGLLLPLSHVRVARAQSLEALLRTGNQAYFEGRFEQATEHYEKLLAAGVRDADVYFNLGLAYARLSRYGEAIVSFERALRIAPTRPDLEQALQAAHAALGNQRARTRGEATVQARPPLLEALSRSVHEDTLAGTFLGLELAFFVVLLARARLRSEALRLSAAVAAALLGLGCLTSGVLLLAKRDVFQEGEAAIVLREGAELREGPDHRARTRALAHEGARARALRWDGEFLRVRLQNGAEGWMRKAELGLVAPD